VSYRMKEMLTIKSTPGFTFGPIKEFVVSNQGFAIFPVKVRKCIIKAFAMQTILYHSFV